MPDLCRAASEKDPLLERLARAPSLRVAACHPRAVRALFEFAGHPLGENGVEFINWVHGAPEATARAIRAPAKAPSPHEPPPPKAESDWIPWFPVIDRARCTGCRQCLSFCLFGVYGLSDGGQVEVQKPRACKNGCPACARICPEVAIIFPKCPDAPIDGTEIVDETLERAKVKVNLKEMLGDNPLRALQERRKQARGRRLLKPDASK